MLAGPPGLLSHRRFSASRRFLGGSGPSARNVDRAPIDALPFAGAIVLGKVAAGELDGMRFPEWLDQALTRAEDRALFELDPRSTPRET